MNILLSGVVGSTAYGLAGPDSDVDRLGLFAHDTMDLLVLSPPKSSIVSHDPDVTLHEALKYVQLALACNPTVLELMFLKRYEALAELGEELVRIRGSFLSAKRVRDAYLGYATQQFERLKRRGGTSFDSDIPERRVAKHARHLARLCHQGLTLYRTGELVIRLEEPQKFLDFGESVAAGDLGVAEAMLRAHEDAFDAAKPAIPQAPDERAVERWLREVRREFWG